MQKAKRNSIKKNSILWATLGSLKSFHVIATLAIILTSLCLIAGTALAQTPGIIVKQAGTGRPVLDPNLDGYISITSSGFNANDRTESEIPYNPIPVPATEPISDLANGPSGGFTDFVDLSGAAASSYMYLTADSNLIFRFRLGSIAPNSKGYSILIDTDQKFGNTGATPDPNYTAANPGFEVEILLATNFGVRLYHVDGLSTPGAPLTTLAYADYAQKSVALTQAGGNADYFIDFYMPFTVIHTYLPAFTRNTPFRLVASAVSSAQSALAGTVADVSGLDDRNYSNNAAIMWQAVVGCQVPFASGSAPPTVRTLAPVVNPSIAAGAPSVSGTSTEANGTVVTLYKNGVSVGTTTVASNAWTVSGLTALANGQSITATALATGKQASVLSTAVTVGAAPATSAAPIVLFPILAGSTTVLGLSTEPPGSIIKIFKNGTLMGTTTVSAFGTWVLGSLAPATLVTLNSITATATGPGKTESASSGGVTVLGLFGSTTATPAITGTFTEGGTSVTGTAASLSSVSIYEDGFLLGTVTAGLTGNWTLSGLTANDLYAGGVLTAKATSTGSNESAASAGVTVQCATQSNKTVTPATQSVCQHTQAGFQVLASSATALYTLRNAANTADAGKSALGNGGTLNLSSNPLTGAGTAGYRINALRTEAPSCPALALTAAPSVTVNPVPATSLAVTPAQAVVCSGSPGAISVAGSQSGFLYQLKDSTTSANIGSAVTGNGGAISLPAGTITATREYKVLATDATLPTNCAAMLGATARIRQNCPGAYVKLPELDVNQYHNGDTLAWPTDPDGVAWVAFSSGALPPGTTLTPKGRLVVSNWTAMLPGTYNFSVMATDQDGMAAPHSLSFTFGTSVLPVSLLYFRAEAGLSGAGLRWGTTQEKNAARFDVESSRDGKVFHKVGSVQAHGTTLEAQEYAFEDKAAGAGLTYYRLRSVDRTGETSLSPVVSVRLGANGRPVPALVPYPNPVRDVLTVRGLTNTHQYAYEICDPMGRSMQRGRTAPPVDGELRLTVKGLPAGSYALRIEDGATRHTARFQVR